MGRVGLIMGVLALVAVALSNLIPGIGQILLAPLASIIIGAGAGWWASKVLGYGTAGRGAGAGAIAGIGALLGAVIGFTILLSIFGNTPAFQEGLNQAQQQNPDAQLPENLDPSTLLGLTGAAGGFCLGLFYLFLSTIGGLIAGLVYGRNRGPAVATPAGSYPAGTSPGFPSATTAPGTEPDRVARTYPEDEDEGRARVYPADERRE